MARQASASNRRAERATSKQTQVIKDRRTDKVCKRRIAKGDRFPNGRGHEKDSNLLSDFNPRAREGRDFLITAHQLAQRNFNPRAREGRDLKPIHTIHRNRISIHAPVKSATEMENKENFLTVISIHAPVKGATWKNR